MNRINRPTDKHVYIVTIDNVIRHGDTFVSDPWGSALINMRDSLKRPDSIKIQPGALCLIGDDTLNEVIGFCEWECENLKNQIAISFVTGDFEYDQRMLQGYRSLLKALRAVRQPGDESEAAQ